MTNQILQKVNDFIAIFIFNFIVLTVIFCCILRENPAQLYSGVVSDIKAKNEVMWASVK